MASKFSGFAVSWRQTIPGTTLFKHPLSQASQFNLGTNELTIGVLESDRAVAK